MTILNYNSLFISQAGESELARLGLISRWSPSYVRKLGRESSEQVIKLLVRSFRRLRLFFCGLLTRPTAPRHAPQTSEFPSNPRSAPKCSSIVPEKLRLSSTIRINRSRLAQLTLHNTRFITSPIFLFHVSTLVVQLFTFCYTNLDFYPRARPVHRKSC